MSNINKRIKRNGQPQSQHSDNAGFFPASNVDFLEDSIVSADFNAVITGWNKGAERVYGYAAAEAVGKPLTMLASPEDSEQVLAGIESIRRGGKVEVYETERVHEDGRRIHLSVKLSPVADDRGEITGVSIAARDITERRETEKRLRQSEEALREAHERIADILESTADCFFALDDERRFIYVNSQTENYFGIAKEQMLGRSFTEVLPQSKDIEILQRQDEAFNERKPSHFEVQSPVTKKWVEIHIHPTKTGLATYFRDITDRKNALQSLRQSEERLRLAVGISQISAFEIDLLTDEVETDDTGRKIYGFSIDEPLTFAKVQSHFHPDDKEYVMQSVAAALEPQGADGFQVEQRIVRTDGEIRWIRVHGRGLFAGEGDERRAVRCLGTYIDITERKKAEEKIRESEERYRTLFNSIDEGFCVIEVIFDDGGKAVDYRFIETNPAFEEQTGLKNAEGKTIRELTPNIEDFWFETYGKIAETGEAARFENHSAALNRWFDVYAFRIGGEESRKVSILFNDISQRKKAEENLSQSREMLRLAMSGSKMGAWSRNLLTEEVYWSPELEAIFGLATGTFAGTIGGFYDYVYEEDKAPIKTEVQRALEERRSYIIEFRYHHADGGIRWMEGRGQALLTADGTPTNVYGIGIDITERKRAELNAEFLAAVSHDLAQVSTPDEIVRVVGERLNRFSGVSVCAFIEIDESAQLATIKYEWHKAEMPDLTGVYDLPVFVTGEFLQMARSGLPIVISDVSSDRRIAEPERFALLKIGAHLNVPLIGNGEWKFSLGVYHTRSYEWREDEIALMSELASRVWARLERAFAEQEREAVLEREQAARVQAEEASRLKDEFLATVSHELRTPLNAILGWSQMLASGNFDQDFSSRALETIYRNAKSQAQLIEDILDVSRIITGKLKLNLKPISLAPVIQSVVESLRPSIEAKNIRVQTKLDFAPPTVDADADRFQQVIWNLLANAVKFTPEKGVITIELETGAAATVIKVSDTGKGISPEFLPFVFDRFRQADGSTTRQHGGLGLGLAIVRHIVELHGGTVQVASAGDGRGTTFTVSLPLPETAPANTGETNESDAENSQTSQPMTDEGEPIVDHNQIKGLRVLLIDDEKDTLDLIATILTQNGAQVSAHLNVRGALEAIKEWKPQLIISDIAMPEEDGYSFIKKLRALPPADGGTIPALALTAYVGIKERTQVLASGFQMYVPKPVESSELLAAVTSLA